MPAKYVANLAFALQHANAAKESAVRIVSKWAQAAVHEDAEIVVSSEELDRPTVDISTLAAALQGFQTTVAGRHIRRALQTRTIFEVPIEMA